MPYSFVQSASKTTTAGPTNTENITINGVSAGSLLVLVSKQTSDGRDITSVVDDQSNSWAAATVKTGGSSALVCWYAPNVSSGDTTLTITYNSASTTNIRVYVLEYSQLVATPLDVFDSDTVFSTSVTTGPVTPTVNGALVLTAGFSESAGTRPLSIPSGFTARIEDTDGDVRIADKRITDTTDQSVNWAVTGGNARIHGHVMIFEEAAAAASAIMNQIQKHNLGADLFNGSLI